eukprot:1132681-Pyramimonas_sp.AAC.1
MALSGLTSPLAESGKTRGIPSPTGTTTAYNKACMQDVNGRRIRHDVQLAKWTRKTDGDLSGMLHRPVWVAPNLGCFLRPVNEHKFPEACVWVRVLGEFWAVLWAGLCFIYHSRAARNNNAAMGQQAPR